MTTHTVTMTLEFEATLSNLAAGSDATPASFGTVTLDDYDHSGYVVLPSVTLTNGDVLAWGEAGWFFPNGEDIVDVFYNIAADCVREN